MYYKYFWIFFFILSLNGSIFSQESRYYSILKKKEIVISVNKSYEPFFIEEPNEGFPGFDIELGNALAEYLGVNAKFIPIGDFDDHLKALNQEKVDITIAGYSSNLKRAREIHFSDPYLITTPAGLVNRQNLPPEPEGQIVVVKPFKDILDLKFQSGISFAVKSSTLNHEFVKLNFENSKIYSYLSNNLAFDALLRNNVNCFIADGLYIEALLQKKPSLKVNYLPLLGSVSEEHISMVLPKNDLLFTYKVNFFIKEMKRSGRIHLLKQKYFNNNGWVKKS